MFSPMLCFHKMLVLPFLVLREESASNCRGNKLHSVSTEERARHGVFTEDKACNQRTGLEAEGGVG